MRKRRERKISICIDEIRGSIVVSQVTHLLNWKTVAEHEPWDIFWSDQFPPASFCRKMRRFQRINHFPGMYGICRKDLLARNLTNMQKYHTVEYDFFPKTWIFPYDFAAACSHEQLHPDAVFILKPVASSQGRGIEIVMSLRNIDRYRRVVCQVYMQQPLLLDGLKFDLRVYALITSIEPLQIFVYNEGLVRLATQQYETPRRTNLANKYMHLTNYSINKYSSTFSEDAELGSKRTFGSFNKLLKNEGHNVNQLWRDIDDIIIKTVLSVKSELRHSYRTLFPNHDRITGCFEILGFDIIIDQMLRPYLLEVNHSPSFSTETLIDDSVKTNLIRDTFALLNIQVEHRTEILNEDKQRVLLRQKKPRKSKNLYSSLPAGNGDGSIKKPAGNDKINISKNTNTEINVMAGVDTSFGIGQFRNINAEAEKYESLLTNGISISSIYNGTVLSKLRAESGKELRKKFDERSQASLVENTVVVDNTPRKIAQNFKAHDKTGKTVNSYQEVTNAGYIASRISLREESERLQDLLKRDLLVKKSGISLSIYEGFLMNGLLHTA